MPRGRGRGRGRGGGRGGRNCSRRGRSGGNADEQENTEAVQDVDIDTHPREFFVGVVSTEKHLEAQKKNRFRYAAALSVLQKNGVAIAQNSRIRALSMAWARNDNELADALLKNRDEFGLPEVLKAVQLLDSGRQLRVLEHQLKRLQLSTTKVNPKKLGKIKSDIDNLTALKPPMGSASGCVCKQVAKWVRGFSKSELEFYALHLPKEPWKKLADVCHFNPANDFAALPWFLPFCFGAEAPDGTMVKRCRDITPENVNSLVVEYDIPYSHLKALQNSLTDESKARIAEYEEKLDTVLWYYEDLQCEAVDAVVMQRLAAKEPITLASGKLLERLLTFKLMMQQEGKEICFLPSLITLAEPRLTSIKLTLESPIVVIGDKSGSMDVAIRTSTIIASLLSAITAAKLVFFNNGNHEASFMPETVEQVLELAVTTEAEGGTAPAASLWPFYQRKVVVKTFIVVTDEEENSSYEDHMFSDLYQKYYEEVYPARLVFISFLSSQHEVGQMVSELKALGYSPLQFKFQGYRPDLSKLDSLFGLLSSDSATFEDELLAAELCMKSEGIAKVFESVKDDREEEKEEESVKELGP